MNICFFDIDGTLANGKEVPESAKLAIRKLREAGNLVWICTGRALKYAKANFHQYANGYIVCNGREGYTCCEKVFDRPLTEEQIQDVKQRLDSIKAGYCFFTSNHGYYFGPQEGYPVISGVWDEGFVLENTPLPKQNIYNFDVWFQDIDHRHEIEKVLSDLALVNPHGPHPTADITILGWTKGDAIQAIAEYMKVPMENTYAFGDGVNDISMLKAAGHGIAMGNANEAVKKVAEFVTTDINEDGIYNGLKHYGLIK